MGFTAVALQKRVRKGGSLLETWIRVVIVFAFLLGIASQSFAAVDDTSSLFDDEALDLTTFDHLATGFPLDGNHYTADCESCHIGGVFEGLPKKCESCHDGSFAIGKDSGHIRDR